MLYILDIPYSVTFFFFSWILANFSACNFLNRWIPHQIKHCCSSYLSVLWNIWAFNSIACPWARAVRVSYFLLHLPPLCAVPSSSFCSHTRVFPDPWSGPQPLSKHLHGVWECLYVHMAGSKAELRGSGWTTASIYVTEYFPCNRTNKRQARSLIKYLWSSPGTPNDYTYFFSERRNLSLAGAGNPNQTQLVELYLGQFILGYLSTRQLMC